MKIKIHNLKWVIGVTIGSFMATSVISVISEPVLKKVNIIGAFCVLIMIVFFGVFFDTIGIAVASANEKRFHAMSACGIKESGAAVRIIRNAGIVSNFCNDVMGDIAGIISGVASATIVIRVANLYGFDEITVLSVILSSIVASLTIGGKALGKEVGIKKSEDIVYSFAKKIYFIEQKLGFKILKLKSEKRRVK